MFRSWATRLKPKLYYSDNNLRIGSYILGRRDIRFIPTEGTHVEYAIKACIDLSNEYKMPAYMFFLNNIKIDIPYPTSSDEANIKSIADEYNKKFKATVMGLNYVK